MFHSRREGCAEIVEDYILPLIFTKRLCDVFDDELNRIAARHGRAWDESLGILRLGFSAVKRRLNP